MPRRLLRLRGGARAGALPCPAGLGHRALVRSGVRRKGPQGHRWRQGHRRVDAARAARSSGRQGGRRRARVPGLPVSGTAPPLPDAQGAGDCVRTCQRGNGPRVEKETSRRPAARRLFAVHRPGSTHGAVWHRPAAGGRRPRVPHRARGQSGRVQGKHGRGVERLGDRVFRVLGGRAGLPGRPRRAASRGRHALRAGTIRGRTALRRVCGRPRQVVFHRPRVSRKDGVEAGPRRFGGMADARGHQGRRAPECLLLGARRTLHGDWKRGVRGTRVRARAHPGEARRPHTATAGGRVPGDGSQGRSPDRTRDHGGAPPIVARGARCTGEVPGRHGGRGRCGR